MTKSIAITGKGIICAIGSNPDAVLESLCAKHSGITRFTHLESCHSELPVGEVHASDADLKRTLGIDENREISRTSLLGAIALKQAISESGLTPDILDSKRVVLISGTTVGGMDITERHFGSDCGDCSYITSHDCGSNTKEIAELAGLQCRCLTISTACSSALNAITLGARMLLQGEADIVLAGGTEALSKFHLNGFNSLMILDTDRCRPFDATRRGLNLGEGAAYVTLCRADESFGEIQAYIAGYGNRCDAFHQTATSANGEGAYLAMQDAIEMSGISPEQIGYVNAHGTGTPDNDRSESAALRRVFGENMPPVASTKSLTGHTTSASGSIETVISMLAMQNMFTPVGAGWEHEDSDCIKPAIEPVSKPLEFILCNSFGFGGNDSSLLLSEKPVSLKSDKIATDVVRTGYCKIREENELAEVRQYVPAMEARRMNKLLKAATLTSLKALQESGVDKPDAIVIGTQFGMLEQGEKILHHIADRGEDGISPTLFMQSTHNTIAGALAIRLGCHGYNLTFSNGDNTREDTIEEAKRLISEGKANHVLVGIHDYMPEHFCRLYERAGKSVDGQLYSEAIIISSSN